MGKYEMIAGLLTLLAGVITVATAGLELAQAAIALRRARLAEEGAATGAADDAANAKTEARPPTPGGETLSRRRRRYTRPERGIGSTTTRDGWYRKSHLSGPARIRYSGVDDREK